MFKSELLLSEIADILWDTVEKDSADGVSATAKGLENTVPCASHPLLAVRSEFLLMRWAEMCDPVWFEMLVRFE